MHDNLIDVDQIELYLEELRRNPADRDPRLDELVELYTFQHNLSAQLIRQEHEETQRFRQQLIRQWQQDS